MAPPLITVPMTFNSGQAFPRPNKSCYASIAHNTAGFRDSNFFLGCNFATEDQKDMAPRLKLEDADTEF